jgi:hypothetical protein
MELTELEAELRLFVPPDDAGSFALPPLAPIVEATDEPLLQPMLPLGLPPAAKPLPQLEESTRTYASERMKVAVALWFNMEARAFTAEPPLSGADMTPRLLCALGLESLEHADESNIHLSAVTPSRVLARLFAIASSGGPHEGYDGAYGRLHAWQSLGALAGASPDDTMEEVMAQALACRWFHFQAESDWFYQVGWDLGIVALRPAGDELAVLAASATD